MQDAWELDVCMLNREKTYAEVRNLGVKAQGSVEWYVTGYTSIS